MNDSKVNHMERASLNSTRGKRLFGGHRRTFRPCQFKGDITELSAQFKRVG
jgi:hypothetical protein